jgi:type IV secretion system protein VirD4
VSPVANVHSIERGIYLGRTRDANVYGGGRKSTLVLGPTRSGKTSCVLIPNVLLAEGSVVTTSTKDDVARATTRARQRVGHVTMFDPSGTIECPRGVEQVGWSPIAAATTWDGAVLAADALADATRLRARGAGSPDHWTERAKALLAPLVHAAALEELGISTLATWVDRRRATAALSILESRLGEDHQSAASLAGLLATDQRELSGIWSTTSGLLAAWRTDAARASAESPPLDVDAFVSGAHTLHVVSPSRHQVSAAPLVVGLIDAVVHATYDARRDDVRLLLALDELANVAPLPALPSVVSEGAGQGVLVLACLQDLSQARVRWGTAADGFLSLFPTSMVLAGIADRPTLDAVSALAGRRPTTTVSVSHAARRRSVTTAIVERSRLPVDEVARGRPGCAIVLDARKQPWWVELTPAHDDDRLHWFSAHD